MRRFPPSWLASSISGDGASELKNLSEIGYVSTQELIALFRELQAGYRPDVVIFYDGVNDTTSALLEGEAGLSTNEVNRRQEFNLLQSPARLSAALISKLVKDSGSYRFAQAVRRRSSGDTNPSRSSPTDETMRALAAGSSNATRPTSRLPRSWAAASVFALVLLAAGRFYQAGPGPIRTRGGPEIRLDRREIFRDVYGKVRDSAELKGDPAFRDLSRIFDDSRNLVFIDYCHTTESANARVAAEMALGVIEDASTTVGGWPENLIATMAVQGGKV